MSSHRKNLDKSMSFSSREGYRSTPCETITPCAKIGSTRVRAPRLESVHNYMQKVCETKLTYIGLLWARMGYIYSYNHSDMHCLMAMLFEK